MKRALIALAMALATAAACGKTGSDAAALITSQPDTKSQVPESANLEMMYYDKDTKEYDIKRLEVKDDYIWQDVLNGVQAINVNLTSVAANAMQALTKTAFLEAKEKFTQDRIDSLTESVQKAFRSLDRIDLVDEVNGIRKTLTMQAKSDNGTSGMTYSGADVFNVAGAQADGLSIVSNSQGRLELKNFSLFKSIKGVQPYIPNSTDGLLWDIPWLMYDDASIRVDTDSNNRPSKEGDRHGIHIKGWYSQGACQAKLSKMLTDQGDSDNRGNHMLLARYGTGNDAELHYVPLGDVIGAAGSCTFEGTDGSTATGTNVVFSGSNCDVSVSGSDGTVTIQIEACFR